MALKFPLIPPLPFPPSRLVCECTLLDTNATNVWKFQTYINQLDVESGCIGFSAITVNSFKPSIQSLLWNVLYFWLDFYRLLITLSLLIGRI
jgi:hypothetical protein